MAKGVALITGAASGIGAEVSRQLADAGARVVLLDVDEERGGRLAEDLGGLFIRCNVADRGEWQAAVERCVDAVGVPALAHLNAGVMSVRPEEPFLAIEALPEASYRRIIDVNIGGVVFGLQALLPLMRGSGGAICVTASLAGLIPLPFDPMYAATKHALIGLVRSVAAAAPDGSVRINAICPGGVDTPLITAALRGDEMAVMPASVLAAEVLDLLERGANGEIRLRASAAEPAEVVPASSYGVPAR
jgi:NAD(P)-dependent dehydrogenase (short-subunit alcohol dehydrogenase family)